MKRTLVFIVLSFFYCGAGFGMEKALLIDSDESSDQEQPLDNSEQSTDAQISLKVSKKKKKKLSLCDQLIMIKAAEYDKLKQLIADKKLDKATSEQLYNELKLENLGIKDLKKTVFDPSKFLVAMGLSKQEEKFKKKINITKLYLAHNKLKNLPNELGTLKLMLLDISHNAFEEFPPAIKKCSKTLKTLDASHNNIKSLFTLGGKKISSFTMLIEVNVQGNDIKTLNCLHIQKRYVESGKKFKIIMGYDNPKKYFVSDLEAVDIMNRVCSGKVQFILKQPSEHVTLEDV